MIMKINCIILASLLIFVIFSSACQPIIAPHAQAKLPQKADNQGFTLYKLDARAPYPQILSGHLKMGGKNPQGGEINANNMYLTFDGKPFLPVMGEFHFSRYPY